jgi:hypothetical protein
MFRCVFSTLHAYFQLLKCYAKETYYRHKRDLHAYFQLLKCYAAIAITDQVGETKLKTNKHKMLVFSWHALTIALTDQKIPTLCQKRPTLCQKRPTLCRKRPTAIAITDQKRPALCQKRPTLCRKRPTAIAITDQKQISKVTDLAFRICGPGYCLRTSQSLTQILKKKSQSLDTNSPQSLDTNSLFF